VERPGVPDARNKRQRRHARSAWTRRKERTLFIRKSNKHIPVGVSLNGERLIVVHIVIVDYLPSLVGGGPIIIRAEDTMSNL